MYFIYKFENKVNNKVYIGSTNDVKRRYNQHIYGAKNPESRLQYAIKKYGKESFDFQIISTVFHERDLDNVEQWFIDYFKSNDRNFGYNAIGVLKGQRELISTTMRNEWKNPKKREKRLKGLKQHIETLKLPIIRVSIYDGSYQVYECVNDAIKKEGWATGIYNCFNGTAKTSQRNCWFYYEEKNPQIYIKKAEELLGGFKTDYFKPFKSINKETGQEFYYKNIFELNNTIFKPKAVRRVLRGERDGYAGYYWKYL